MLKVSNKVIVLAIVVILIGIIAFFIVWREQQAQSIGQPEPQEHIKDARSILPRVPFPVAWLKAPTLKLPSTVQCIKTEAQANGVALPVGLVKDVAAAFDLEMPHANVVGATRVRLSREDGKLNCLIWSERGRRALNISDCQSIKGVPVTYKWEEGQGPNRATTTDFAKAGIKRLDISSTYAGTKLVIESKFGEKRIPFGNFFDGECCVAPGYRFAAITKKKRDSVTQATEILSVLIVDTEALTLCCEIEYPKPRGDPEFILDPKTNGFVVVENCLAWMIVVDLEPLFKKATAKE